MNFKTIKRFFLVLSAVAIIGIALKCWMYTSSYNQRSNGSMSKMGVAAELERDWDKINPFVCDSYRPSSLRQQKRNMFKLLRKGVLSLSPPTEEWEFPLPVEKALLSFRPLEDPLKAGNSTTSIVKIIGPQEGYRKGDNVTVMVTIRDGYRQPCKQGGDQVRVWLRNMKLGASLATEVDDLGNGSYVAVLPLTWSGKAGIRVSLAYNLAVQRSYYYARYLLGSTRFMAAGFRQKVIGEVTLCSPFRKILRYAKVCNFTTKNGGMPWFCGFPKHANLSCSDWKFNFDFEFGIPLPNTEAEEIWWKEIRKKYIIPSNIIIAVGERADEKPTKIPACNTIPLRDTWKSKAPRGYFMNGEWIPTTCSYKRLTKDQINKCLHNTTVLHLGDSNALKTYTTMALSTDCEKSKTRNPLQWHQAKVCSNGNLTIHWQSHAIPFHTGSHDGVVWTNQKAVNKYIDEIPADGRFLVIVHFFIHLSPHRDELFIKHIRGVRVSVEKLLKRNPNAKVVVRGPHRIREHLWFPPDGGDLVAPFYTKYIKDAFEGLQDSVLFIQPWDMTVAQENDDVHPADHVTKAINDVMLGHLCVDTGM